MKLSPLLLLAFSFFFSLLFFFSCLPFLYQWIRLFASSFPVEPLLERKRPKNPKWEMLCISPFSLFCRNLIFPHPQSTAFLSHQWYMYLFLFFFLFTFSLLSFTSLPHSFSLSFSCLTMWENEFALSASKHLDETNQTPMSNCLFFFFSLFQVALWLTWRLPLVAW